MKTLSRIIAIMLIAVAPAQATLLQLDFSGELVIDLLSGDPVSHSISGQLLLDSSTPDSRPEPDNGRYEGAVAAAEMVVDGVVYELLDGGFFNDVFVLNDFSDPGFDGVAILATMINASGDAIDLGLEFYDGSMSVFDGDSFPTEFSLADFDPYVPGDSSTTAVYLIDFVSSRRGPLSSATLRPVPVTGPATAWLLLAGLGTWLVAAARSRANRRG